MCEMEFEAEKLRDEVWRYRDLRVRITDERTREALAQLIEEKEERLRHLDEEPPEDARHRASQVAGDVHAGFRRGCRGSSLERHPPPRLSTRHGFQFDKR
jgi:hypothetical protein